MASGFEFAQAFGFLLSKAEVGDSGTDHHLLYTGSPKPFAAAFQETTLEGNPSSSWIFKDKQLPYET